MKELAIEQGSAVANPNMPMPEYAAELQQHIDALLDASHEATVLHYPGLKALHTQTLNHLRHANFAYEVEPGSEDYPHNFVYPGRYPARPVALALEKSQ